MRKKTKWVVICLVVTAILLPVCAWADFTMTDPQVTNSGSGNANSTSVMTNENQDWRFLEPGFSQETELSPSSGATSWQYSSAYAYNGTAEASTGGTLVDTNDGVDEGDTVTAMTAGSTSAAAQRENNTQGFSQPNFAGSDLFASGGAGTVMSGFFETSTGFMAVESYTSTDSTGSTDDTAGTDASASSDGAAGVEYTFAGRHGPETLTIANADTASTADVADSALPTGAAATSVSTSTGVVGWSDNSDLTGWGFGAFLNLNSEVNTIRYGSQVDSGLPSSTATAAAALDLNFIYRPQDRFSFVGNVTGSTDSEANITQGTGLATAQGIKAAVGTAGTQTDLPTGALAFIAGNVLIYGETPNGGTDAFDATAEGHAVNPAVLGEGDFDPDPLMTVGSQYGEYSAAMGSSSLVNAEVTATGDADEYEHADSLMSSAFAFAAAYDRNDNNPYITSALADGTEPFAIVGQGSLVGADTAPDGTANTTAATATVLNMFGTAISPDFEGAMSNGNSSGSIAQDDDLVFQRLSSASADSVTGTNLYEAFAYNASNVTFDGTTVPRYADLFENFITTLDHFAFGRIIGGGE